MGSTFVEPIMSIVTGSPNDTSEAKDVPCKKGRKGYVDAEYEKGIK